jgi:hypothetical protein
VNKYWKELRPVLIAGIGAFILALILPARVTITCRELISYAVLALFKNWIVTVMAVLFALFITIALGHFQKKHRKKSTRRIGARIGIFSAITLTATFGFSLYCDLLSSPQNLPAVGFAGCFTVGADGVLVEDSDAEYIAESLFLAGQKAASGHSSFNLGLINLYKVQTPSFLPPMLGQKNCFFERHSG